MCKVFSLFIVILVVISFIFDIMTDYDLQITADISKISKSYKGSITFICNVLLNAVDDFV